MECGWYRVKVVGGGEEERRRKGERERGRGRSGETVGVGCVGVCA